MTQSGHHAILVIRALELIYFKTKSDTGLKVEQTMAVILLVEDEEQVRVLADSFLQVEGNKTLSAGTVQQALALIEGDETIDLLFVDLKIQDDVEGGLKLAKKAVEARPNLKVLYTSGQAVTDGMMALFVEIHFSTEALYGRAVGYDPPRQI